MKKLLPAFLTFVLAALAQTSHPNFTGQWEMDLSKSSFGQFGAPRKVTLTITHHEPGINVRTMMVVQQGPVQSDANYTTGGALDTNSDPGATTKTHSRWEKDELVIEGHVFIEKRPPINMRERWSLADRGQTFVNDRTLYLPNGQVTQKLVYSRVGVVRTAKK
jgi:hypothetical protein